VPCPAFRNLHAEADGRRVVDKNLGEHYDVVIVDRMVPGLDGLTVVKTLRGVGVKTPILLLTTMGGVSDRVQGLEAGGDDYLVKPFAYEELLAWAPGNSAPRHGSPVSGGHETREHPEERRRGNCSGCVHAHGASAAQDAFFAVNAPDRTGGSKSSPWGQKIEPAGRRPLSTYWDGG
jgi:CheY-like chemotaxis protein